MYGGGNTLREHALRPGRGITQPIANLLTIFVRPSAAALDTVRGHPFYFMQRNSSLGRRLLFSLISIFIPLPAAVLISVWEGRKAVPHGCQMAIAKFLDCGLLDLWD